MIIPTFNFLTERRREKPNETGIKAPKTDSLPKVFPSALPSSHPNPKKNNPILLSKGSLPCAL
jgi:hypothetical protein